MASRITGQSNVFSTICLVWQQRNIKGPRFCPFVRGVRRWAVDSPHKGTATRKMFPLDDVIMVRFEAKFEQKSLKRMKLTHLGWVTNICIIKKKKIIVSNTWLSPVRHKAIICTNSDLLLIGLWKISVKFKSKHNNFYTRNLVWKCGLHLANHSSCPGLNVIKCHQQNCG